MRKGKVVLTGTLAGLAIGALAGMLFAPEKGRQTRRQIRVKSDDYMIALKSQLDKFGDLLAGKDRRAEREAEKLARKGKSEYDHLKKDAKNAASDIRNSVS